VLVVPNARLEWIDRYYHDALIQEPLLTAFRKLHPDMNVEISTTSESTVEQDLLQSHSRGLGPDLVLLHGPKAIALLNLGVVDPLPSGDPQLRRTLSQVEPSLLKRVTTPRGTAGLPVFSELTLACYDRRRLNPSPRSLSALLAVAAAGKPVGLSVDAMGLWWTAGALGASRAMTPILLSMKGERPGTLQTDRSDLLRWLQWLRQSSMQGRIDVATGPRDLTLGLESGRLAWIPCFSPLLLRLSTTMGRNLGVAALPGGPQGPPSPFLSPRVWALGSDSSPRQRKLALEMARLSLDPLVQRDITLNSRYVIPANRFVPIPVASSGRLAALAEAQAQYNANAFWHGINYSEDELAGVVPRIESLLTQVMEGILTPSQGTDALLEMRQARR
jgi:hypothetical protein